nr:hypothetical protein [uncultured Brevundimonas sp.]
MVDSTIVVAAQQVDGSLEVSSLIVMNVARFVFSTSSEICIRLQCDDFDRRWVDLEALLAEGCLLSGLSLDIDGNCSRSAALQAQPFQGVLRLMTRISIRAAAILAL